MEGLRRHADTASVMGRRLVHDEQGIALVLTLMTVLVLSVVTGALLTVVAVNHRSAADSSNARRAFGIAQSGLAYAEGNLYGAEAAHGTPTAGQTPFSQDGGTGLWWSSVAGDGHTWTMHGQGTYLGTTRSVAAQADVPSPVTVNNSGVWNYLYADSISGACPTSIGGSTSVNVPTLTRGNLCILGSATFNGSQLEVGGNLTVSGSARIGSSGHGIPTLQVAGTTCQGVTPGTGACDGVHSPVFANSVASSLSVTPQMPPINLANAYSTANPGPGTGHGCQVGSNAPSPFFDSDSTLNHSVAAVNLFPAARYDCVNGANEIRWCPSVDVAHNCNAANTMYVNGTFFFDGNLNISGSVNVIYTGQGTLYFSGTITTAGSGSICGIANCTTAWNPDTSGIVFVAGCWNNSTGSQLVSIATTGTYCVNYGGSTHIQVGTYCATDYTIAGSAGNMGPVLANTLSLNGSTSTLIPFHIMPPGTPLNTSTSYLPASAPTYWNG